MSTEQLSLTELMHGADFDPDPEPEHPRCARCGRMEPEGEFYGWELFTGAWDGGLCQRCYLGGDR